MANAETGLMHSVMLALNGIVTLFRNNVGTTKLRDGTWLRYGLCVGSSDLVGWKSVVVGPEMVGKRVAVFVALEIKTPNGAATPEQLHFIQTVVAAGGIAAIVRGVDEAKGVCS